MIIDRIWKEQPGRYFCISTKSATGEWEDHFFTRSKFKDIPQFTTDHADKDIYFCPHGFTKPRRLKKNAEIPKILWADLDEADPRDFDEALLPTVAFESSPGRFVGLWLTTDFINEELNRRLTYHLEADKGGWDFTQVLRFPGTKNYKYESTPKVKIMWSDGAKYSVDDIEKAIPQEKKRAKSATDARAIYKKYERKFSGFIRRELLRGKPRTGKRSEVFWRLVNDLLEAGVSEDEAFELLRVSPWNKFKKRRDGDEQLRRELDKAVGGHFNVYDDEKGERKPKRYEDTDDDTDDYEENPRLNIQKMSDVEAADIDWIWYPYLARGEVTILEGDPGLGKSYLAQMAALAICDGKILPSPKKKPGMQGKVMYFDIENSADAVTKRRLEYNGCQHMENYFQVEEAFSIDDEDYLELVYDAMEQVKPTLVVFDTLNTYMGGADTHKASETQQVFKEFKIIARRFNCSMLVLRHLTKGQKGRSAIYAGQGSIAFTGLARIVMTCGHHPDPDMDQENIMAITKINVAKAPKALSYSIEGLPDTVKDQDRSKFHWGEFVDYTSDEIVNTDRKRDNTSEKSQEVIDFLKDFLGSGPMDSRAVRQAAEARSFSTRLLNKIVDEVGIVKEVKREGRTRRSFWELPETLVEN